MARELRRRGVTHVVMKASGVYTEPVYYALCEQDFEQVAMINPAHAKALRGHKTARDCARPAELVECSRMDGVPERPDMHRVRNFVARRLPDRTISADARYRAARYATPSAAAARNGRRCRRVPTP
jgi:transposase